MRHTLSPSIRGLRVVAAYAFLYFALAAAITYPLITHLSTAILRGIDTEDALQQTWVIAWVQHAVRMHDFAFFNAPIFYPSQNTLTYQDNLSSIAILELPVSLIWNNPLVTYNIGVLSSYVLSALAMFALAYAVTRDHRAAFLAGIIFAFCPFRDRHIEHLNLLSAEAIPLIILAFDLARQKGGAVRWLALGLSLALCATLSLYYLAFSVVGILLYIAVLGFNRQTIVGHGALRGIGWLGAGLTITFAAVWPYLVQQHQSGSQRRLQDVVYFSADVRDFLHAGPQSLLFGWTDAVWNIPQLEVRQYLFPGIVAVALTIAGIRRVRTKGPSAAESEIQSARRIAVVFAVVAILLGILALGPYLRLFGRFTGFPLPYLLPYNLLPGFAGYRDVARFDQVAMAYLAIAAAAGASRLFLLVGKRRRTSLFVLLIIAASLESWTVQNPLLPVSSGTSVPAVYKWLARQPQGPVVELPMCGMPGPPCLEESWYMYYSAYHWHPLLNGGGGFYPRDWNSRVANIATFPASRAQITLDTLGDRYVIVHRDYPRFASVVSLLNQSFDPATAESRWRVLSVGADIVIDRGPVTQNK
jgi:hypothetical protein